MNPLFCMWGMFCGTNKDRRLADLSAPKLCVAFTSASIYKKQPLANGASIFYSQGLMNVLDLVK